MRKKKNKDSKTEPTALDLERTYVLFGFCKSDINETGYLFDIPTSDEDDVITDDIDLAKRFTVKNIDSARKYINEEFKEIYGPHAYVFHKVAVA